MMRWTPQSRRVSIAAEAVAPVAMMGSRRMARWEGVEGGDDVDVAVEVEDEEEWYGRLL